MKLTLKPSAPDRAHPFPAISISNHHDDHTCDSVFETLVIPALIAAGFHPDSILDSMRTIDVPGAHNERLVANTCDAEWDPCGVETGPERWLYAGVNTDLGYGHIFVACIKYRHLGSGGWVDTLCIDGASGAGDIEYAVLAGSEAHLAILDAGIMNLENEKEVAV